MPKNESENETTAKPSEPKLDAGPKRDDKTGAYQKASYQVKPGLIRTDN